MWKVKRLLRESEMDHYLKLRDTKGPNPANKYLDSLHDELWEEIDDPKQLKRTHASK